MESPKYYPYRIVSHSSDWDPLLNCATKNRKKVPINPLKDAIRDLKTC